MITPRSHHAAALLHTNNNKDKVLVTGGLIHQFEETYTELTEVYDYKKGTWSAGGSMSIPRIWHTSTLLFSGKVLVVGGNGTTTDPLPVITELYDP